MVRLPALLIFLSCLLFILSPKFGYAQEKCGTVEYEKLRHSKIPNHESEQQFERWMEKKAREKRLKAFPAGRTEAISYVIPVVVHVIHNGEAVATGDNISDAQVISQIQVLNDDFKRLNADKVNTPSEFLPVAASIDIQFVLARQDPQGLPTTGINRVQGTKTSWTMSDNSTFKSLSYWPAESYLNIWVLNLTNNLIGYAQFPVTTQLAGLESTTTDRLTDGIAVYYRAFGSNAAGSFNLDPQFTRGRTATHEVGHFLGLRHIWGDNTNCATDYVNDTPPQSSSTTGCPSHPQSSCGGTKMFQNYLDYTNDACMNIFTAGQIERMNVILASSPRRNSLLTSLGATDPTGQVNDLALTGIVNPGLVHCETNPYILFNVKNFSTYTVTNFQIQRILNGEPLLTLTYNNISLTAGEERTFTGSAVNLNTGANVLTFSIDNLNVNSDATPSNNTITFNSYLDKSVDASPLRVTFDNSSAIAPWLIAKPFNSTPWETVATNKDQSLVYRSFSNTTLGEESWLVSPVLDLSRYAKSSLLFDVSYAHTGIGDDHLKIVASDDCGLTYTTVLFDRAGSELSVGQSSSDWTPSSNTDWKREYVNIGALSGLKNVRLAFVVTNEHGNNLYLDNIEIFAGDDPEPPVTSVPYQLYYSNRNTQSDLAITFNLSEKKDVRLQIFSIIDNVVSDNLLPATLNQTYYFDLSGQAEGLYVFRVQVDNQVSTSKVFIAH